MAVDRGYGSGKPLSATQSRNRRRAAAGQLSKSKKGVAATIKSQRAKLAASPLGQIADTVLGFALPVGKVKAAANAARMAGNAGRANALAARLVTKNLGKLAGKEIARTGSAYPAAMSGYLKGAMAAKETASSVFPKLTMAERFTPPATGRVLKEQIKRTNAAAPRVTELEKRLSFPTVTRGFGTVNPEGYAALQKLPDFLGVGAKQIARKIKKTPKRGR